LRTSWKLIIQTAVNRHLLERAGKGREFVVGELVHEQLRYAAQMDGYRLGQSSHTGFGEGDDHPAPVRVRAGARDQAFVDEAVDASGHTRTRAVQAAAPRPLTFPFAARLLEAAGGRLQEVRIERLVDETFYAQVVVQSSAGTRTFDSRPSDAIALALETGAPVSVARPVMDQAARPRAELSQSRPSGSRSARERADEIRALVAQPKGRWSRPTVF
jgi:bifunctional DNase/RNase